MAFPRLNFGRMNPFRPGGALNPIRNAPPVFPGTDIAPTEAGLNQEVFRVQPPPVINEVIPQGPLGVQMRATGTNPVFDPQPERTRSSDSNIIAPTPLQVNPIPPPVLPFLPPNPVPKSFKPPTPIKPKGRPFYRNSRVI